MTAPTTMAYFTTAEGAFAAPRNIGAPGYGWLSDAVFGVSVVFLRSEITSRPLARGGPFDFA
jgi:hypothetical protein